MKYTLLIISLLIISSSIPLHASPAPKPQQKDDYQFYLKSGHRSPEWNEFIEPAFQSFDGGNLSTAYVFMRRAYDKGCRDGLLLYRLALYQESRGKFREASDMMTQALEKLPKQYPGHPLSKAIHEHAGRIFYQTEEYDKALPEFQKALEISPDNFMALFMAGQILRIKKEYDGARKLLEKALQAPSPEGIQPDPKFQLLKELMALTLELKDFAACQVYIDAALAAAPNDQQALQYKNRIGIERQKQREREAIERIVK